MYSNCAKISQIYKVLTNIFIWPDLPTYDCDMLCTAKIRVRSSWYHFVVSQWLWTSVY